MSAPASDRPAAPRGGKRLTASASASLRMLLAVGISCGLWAAPSVASAYVRYLGKTGCPYAWPKRTLEIRGFPSGMPDMDESQITGAITEAARVWSSSNSDLADCTDLDLQVTMMSLTDVPPEAIFDGKNNVLFEDMSWCDDRRPECADRALAITSVFARTWGEILDADIEVNAVIFNWGDLISDPTGGGGQDLQNALTHEVGHLLGFDHTCHDSDSSSDVGRPLDHTGQGVPNCFFPAPPDEIRATTMFASADPGDVSKRTLEPDELLAICETYPRGAVNPLSCDRPEGGGCAVAVTTSNAGVPPHGMARWPVLAGIGLTVACLGFFAAWAGTRRARIRGSTGPAGARR